MSEGRSGGSIPDDVGERGGGHLPENGCLTEHRGRLAQHRGRAALGRSDGDLYSQVPDAISDAHDDQDQTRWKAQGEGGEGCQEDGAARQAGC